MEKLDKEKVLDWLYDEGEEDMFNKFSMSDEPASKIFQDNYEYLKAIHGSDQFIKTIPTDLTKEEQNKFFQEDPAKIKDYREYIVKFNKQIANKESEAQDYLYGSEYDKETTKNLPIIGDYNWGNEYARKAYIAARKEGKTPAEASKNAWAHEVAGKVAGVADFAPWPVSIAGPAIRTGQKLATDSDVLTAETGADIVLGSLPMAKGVKTGVDYAKRLLGPVGEIAGKTKAVKAVEAAADKIDRSAANSMLQEQGAKSYYMIEDLINAGREPSFKDLQKVVEANPRLQGPVNEYILHKKSLKDLQSEATNTYMQGTPHYIGKTPSELVEDELFQATNDYTKNVIIDQALNNAKNSSRAAQYAARTMPYIANAATRKVPRELLNNNDKELSKQQSNYDRAVDFTIRKYENEWKAGKKSIPPMASQLYLDAYNKWLNEEE